MEPEAARGSTHSGRRLSLRSRWRAVELREGLAVESASMNDYAERVLTAERGLAETIALCGWSMDGLVVLTAAREVQLHSVILLEPSAPSEVHGRNPVSPHGSLLRPGGGVRQVPGWNLYAARESLLARARGSFRNTG